MDSGANTLAGGDKISAFIIALGSVYVVAETFEKDFELLLKLLAAHGIEVASLNSGKSLAMAAYSDKK